LRKILLCLILSMIILGEKKLFYDPDGIILYDITPSKIEIIKKRKLDISNDVNLNEILIKKNFRPIDGIDVEVKIKYVEYNVNKNVYHVYFELSFFDGRVLITKTSDQTLVMGIYDKYFNYIDIKEYPTYISDWKVEFIEVNSKIGMKINPVIMDKEKKFIFGVKFRENLKGAVIYKKNLDSNELETIKSFNNNVFLKTLIENDSKLIYLTFNSFISINQDDNIGKQAFVLDLKNMRTSEIIMDSDLFKKIYYSNEINNTNKELIDKFYKLK
jgi:hypothetical protein